MLNEHEKATILECLEYMLNEGSSNEKLLSLYLDLKKGEFTSEHEDLLLELEEAGELSWEL